MPMTDQPSAKEIADRAYETLTEYYGEDPFNEEKLNPILRFFLTSGKRSGMRMIRSPLYTGLFTSWKEANRVYEWKSKEFEEAMKDGRYGYALSVLIERPYRLEFLRNWWRNRSITREQLRAELPWVWTDAEPNDTERRWVTLFRDATKGVRIEIPMYSEEVFPLPTDDVLTVYRGTHHRTDKLGLAWSLSKDVAAMFTNYMRAEKGTGWIITGEVQQKDILAYLMNRKEFEIDVDPRLVKVVSWEEYKSGP